jgi:hypothetical protein
MRTRRASPELGPEEGKAEEGMMDGRTAWGGGAERGTYKRERERERE